MYLSTEQMKMTYRWPSSSAASPVATYLSDILAGLEHFAVIADVADATISATLGTPSY